MLIKTILMLSILIFGISAQPFAANVDQNLINRIKEAYDNAGTIEANFVQTLTHRESGATEKRNGQLIFRKPLDIRWETAKPNAETLVINKSEIWDYIPDEKLAYRYSPKVVQDSRNIMQVLTGQAKLTQDFKVKNIGSDKGRVKLQLYPKEPTPQLVEAVIWVDPATGYIRKAHVTDFYGNTNEVDLTSFASGKRISEQTFQFKPPKGTEIEDLRDKEIMERELFK